MGRGSTRGRGGERPEPLFLASGRVWQDHYYYYYYYNDYYYHYYCYGNYYYYDLDEVIGSE